MKILLSSNKKIINDYIDYPVRVTYAGRLDKDSEGLLLLTNDGDLIDHLMRGANRHEKEYIVMSFMEKDRCWSSVLIQSLDAAMGFTDALLHAQLDTNIPYNLLVPYWETVGLRNNVDLGVSGPAMEIVIRQICRYKRDRSICYADILNKHPEIGQVSYQFMTSRDLCALSGVFSSISFEDMNAMIDNSINITKSGKPQPMSPIEDLIYL